MDWQCLWIWKRKCKYSWWNPSVMEVLIYRTTVINHLKCFLYLPEEVSHLKILLPCFSSVTHTMWWLAPNFSDGAEFEFAAPSIRLAVLLNGPNLSTPTPPSLGLVEWMTVSRCGGRCWLTDGLLVWCPVQRRSHQRRSRKRSIQEFWGWWRGSPHLSQWRHAESEMYRIYTFFF